MKDKEIIQRLGLTQTSSQNHKSEAKITKPTGDELREALDWIEDEEAFALLSSAITELEELRKKGEDFSSLCSLGCDTCDDTIQSIRESEEKAMGGGE